LKIKDCSGSFNLLQDVGGLRGPDEGLGFFVVAIDVFVDRSDEFFDAAEDTAT
jgi:hypothetical protein